jgi:hypothetical protein
MSEKLGPIETSRRVFCCTSKSDQVLIDNIFSFLISLLKENKKLKNYKEIIMAQENSIFNSKDFLYLSLKDFILYIQEFNDLENYILISAIIYLERFCKASSIILTEYNIHKLLFTSVLLSIKNYEDNYYDNYYYSKIIGIGNKDLNKLEYSLLSILNFELFITKTEYEKYKKYIYDFNDSNRKKMF